VTGGVGLASTFCLECLLARGAPSWRLRRWHPIAPSDPSKLPGAFFHAVGVEKVVRLRLPFVLQRLINLRSQGTPTAVGGATGTSRRDLFFGFFFSWLFIAWLFIAWLFIAWLFFAWLFFAWCGTHSLADGIEVGTGCGPNIRAGE